MNSRKNLFDVIGQLSALRRYARSLTRDDAAAEDLVQDSLLRAYERRDSFRDGGNIRTWLLAILHNAFIDGMRSRKTEAKRLDQIGEGLTHRIVPPIGFSVLVEAANQIARRNKERLVTTGDLRDRTALAVLRLLGGKRSDLPLGDTAEAIAEIAERAEEQQPLQIPVIVDEYGSLEDIATPTEILEAIAGDFPDDEDDAPVIEEGDETLLVEGWIDIRRASSLLEVDLVNEADRYSTLAGYILWRLGHLPAEGEKVAAGELEFEIVSMAARNVEKVRVRRQAVAI